MMKQEMTDVNSESQGFLLWPLMPFEEWSPINFLPRNLHKSSTHNQSVWYGRDWVCPGSENKLLPREVRTVGPMFLLLP